MCLFARMRVSSERWETVSERERERERQSERERERDRVRERATETERERERERKRGQRKEGGREECINTDDTPTERTSAGLETTACCR